MAHKKVLFRLHKDEEGYPPADIEGVWAEDKGDGTFVIDNIPFFTREATLGDVVKVENVEDELFYSSTLESSPNSLLRVVFFDDRDTSMLRSELEKTGCSTEQSHLQSLIAVNVPPTVKISIVREMLDEGCNKGWWDYEEPILRQ